MCLKKKVTLRKNTKKGCTIKYILSIINNVKYFSLLDSLC